MSGGKLKHATIVDVAKAAHVSVATAGRALGDYGYVRPETRRMILEAAQKLNYKKNIAAQSLVSGAGQTFGMIVSDISTEFYANIIKSSVNYCRKYGYCVLVYDTHESTEIEQEALAIFQKHRVDGIIISPVDARISEHLYEFASSGGRLVQIDRCLPDLEGDSVLLDNRQVAKDCTRMLIAAGHRRIAYVGEIYEISPYFLRKITSASPRERDKIEPFAPSFQRFLGYLDAHHEAGLDVSLNLIGRTRLYSDIAAQKVTETVLACAPTALLTADGLMTLGAYRAIMAKKLRIPDDISFISFDDMDWLQLVDPPITAVAQPCAQIGEEAARILLRRAATRNKSEEYHYEHIRLSGTIVERRSVLNVS